jgi:hypothetical protein
MSYITEKRDQYGRLHCEDVDENRMTLPALVYKNGRTEWWKNGEKHRDDLSEDGLHLPAVTFPDGHVEWWKNGERHNDDFVCGVHQPAVITSKRTREWYVNGKRERYHNDGEEELPQILYANQEGDYYREDKYFTSLYKTDKNVFYRSVWRYEKV